MSRFDIIVYAVIAIFTFFGLWKGMARQIFGLVGAIAGYVLAMRFYEPCSRFVTGFHPGSARAISFIAIFLACVIIAHVLGWAVGRLFVHAGLGFLNRIGGGVLGFLKGGILIVVAVMVLTVFFPAERGLFRKSSTIKYILPAVAALKKVTRGDIMDKYNEKVGKEKPASPRRR